MPTYDYKCLTCGIQFEEFQKMTDEPLSKCPECGGTVKRLIGAGAGPIFKGSGFYQTDYKGNNSGNGKTTPVSKPAEKKETPKKSSTPKETK